MRSSAPPLESPANRTQSRTAGGPDINSISRLGSRQVSTRAQSRHSAAASVRPSTTGSAYGDGGSYVVAVLRSKSELKSGSLS
jgi:hypothetical protein